MEGRYVRFTTLAASLYQNIQRIKMLEMEDFDLRSGHVTCLHHFYEHPEGLTPGELTALCDVDKAAISRSLAWLQQKGLLSCGQTDGRRYHRSWTLTPLGLRVAEETERRIDRAVDYVGAFLSQEERARFYENLARIAENLEAYLREKTEEKREGRQGGDQDHNGLSQ